MVLPGASGRAAPGSPGSPVQVVLDGRGTVQPLHGGHEVVQLLQAAILFLEQFQNGGSGAALARQEPVSKEQGGGGVVRGAGRSGAV